MGSTVLLIRHPESAWNKKGIYQGQTDIPLSPLGHVQAERVAMRLRHEPISGIMSSPLRRARSLAQAIARHHHLTPTVDERLTEIAHGTWEGLSRHQVQERFPEMYQAWAERPHDVCFEGGESLADVLDRAIVPVQELLARPDGVWIVVTHDVVCKLLVAVADRLGRDGYSAVNLENAGITTLVGPTLEGSVRRLNDVEHLGEHRVNLGAQAL